MANCAALADALGYPWIERGTESPHKRLRETVEQAPPTGAAADAAAAPQGKGTGAAAVPTSIELSDDDASNDAPRRRAHTKSFDELPDAQEASLEAQSVPPSVCNEDEYALIASQDSVMSCDDPALMQNLADSLKQITVLF